MEDPVYELVSSITSKHNPCYDVANNKTHNVDTVCTSSSRQGEAKAEKNDWKSDTKKPSRARDWSCWCVLIGLVLVGVVACVSMAVAVWSSAKGNSNNCNSCMKETQATNNLIDRIDQLNSTLSSAIDSLRSNISNSENISSTDSSSVISLRNEFDVLVQNFMGRIDILNGTITSSIIPSVQNINGVNTRVSSAVDAFQRELNAFTQTHSGQNPSSPATSCFRIFVSNITAPSGYYWVRASNGSAVRVYCDMTRSCGGVTGGWTRVTVLNYGRSTPCPNSLRERTYSGRRTCGIRSSSGACASVLFNTPGIEYNFVCGKVLAYQFSTPDAFGDFGRGGSLTIDSNYVDGVSLTHGSNPRKHIWTFAAATDEYGRYRETVCRCSHSERDGEPSPYFVGQDYFCDSGISRTRVSSDDGRFFDASPLWDGSGCGSSSTCCMFNNPPWFYKQLPSPTSDAIEMRVCRDESQSNEDIAMSSVEIYIQ